MSEVPVERPALGIADLAQRPTGAAWDFRVRTALRTLRGQDLQEALERLVVMREQHDKGGPW